MTRNLQKGNEEATDILARLVAGLTYKPTWQFRLQEIQRGQGCEGLTLMISGRAPDSWDPSSEIEFLHLFPVLPAAYDEDSWKHWILECVLMVEKHETMEFLKFDGEATFFSEHAPGRNPYMTGFTKTPEQAIAPPVPWNGGPPQDPHFAR